MIKIDYEVIVKYNGDILKLENELGVSVEILSPIYAIITSDDPTKFDNLLNYREIEYIEKPFILETQDTNSFSSTGITNFKNTSGLTGKGTILGLIDSGIDYTLPVFKDSNGKSGKNKMTKETIKALSEKSEWKKYFTTNPDMILYGNNEAAIYDYGIFSESGEPLPIVNNEDEVCVRLKVQFNKKIECPTISVTIKDFHGKEICGNNTNFMGIDTGICNENEEYIFEFKQKLRLAPGKYTLSISCSRFDESGELIVMNRNYDALIFEVTSTKKMVGCFDMDPKVTFKKIEK